MKKLSYKRNGAACVNRRLRKEIMFQGLANESMNFAASHRGGIVPASLYKRRQ